jgi:EAL domain-containing protein (putative c-di-GMP-specific phosphodiesterase class I)
LCQSVIDLGHRFGAIVCAEGVANIEDLRTLMGIGCDTAQGFLFAEPMNREAFARMLLARVAGSKNNFVSPESPVIG